MIASFSAPRPAVVTGAASGIGAATAARLAASGRPVVFVDIDDRVSSAAERAGEHAVGVLADVATESGWAAIAAAAEPFGPVGVLVSNAARQIPATVTELSTADWDAQLAVNVRGAFLGLRTFLSQLTETRGSAVLMSSVHALVGLPAHPAYAASKAALTGLTRQAAVDYAPVRVNCVLPGPILTPMWDGIDDDDRDRSIQQTALKRFGTPEEVAGVVDFLCSADAGYVTGASIVVDGGWSVMKDSA